jgi:hypothetical protein
MKRNIGFSMRLSVDYEQGVLDNPALREVAQEAETRLRRVIDKVGASQGTALPESFESQRVSSFPVCLYDGS